MTTAYDIIGDVHGFAGKLESLLRKLGYVRGAGGWKPPPGRQAVFLGDLIDRGPDQVAVAWIVRSMIDNGDARAIIGNHEFNAIGFATPVENSDVQFLRPWTAKNLNQHREFLRQVGLRSALHRELVEWFRTLPPALDLGGVRVVHAWWEPRFVEIAARGFEGGRMTDDFLGAAYRKRSPEWEAMEGLTKGMEAPLPAPHSFHDHDGVERREVRVRWWHEGPRTYRDIAIVDHEHLDRIPEHPLPASLALGRVDGSPIFVGHYWMKVRGGAPEPMSSKVACLDWSVADGGPLVAYRWDGEREIRPDHFVCA